jgi:hypothetical protein
VQYIPDKKIISSDIEHDYETYIVQLDPLGRIVLDLASYANDFPGVDGLDTPLYIGADGLYIRNTLRKFGYLGLNLLADSGLVEL